MSNISSMFAAGIYEGVQHLAVLGHRKIGFISGPLHLRSAETRNATFLAGTEKSPLSRDSPRPSFEKIDQFTGRPEPCSCSGLPIFRSHQNRKPTSIQHTESIFICEVVS